MIGVFDSGLGGLAILHALVRELPQYSYLYLADSARAPYGNRTAKEIYQFSVEGVEYLFKKGCLLVILGCNTASAVALRRIQQELLPMQYTDHRVLGILVPTVEQISGVDWNANKSLLTAPTDHQHIVGVLATEQTVRSGAYEQEIHKRNPGIIVVQQACPELVPLIEKGKNINEISRVARQYVEELLQKVQQTYPEGALDAVLLGCTHYALVADTIAAALPKTVALYEQPTIVARRLGQYIARHPELVEKNNHKKGVRFLTTGKADDASMIGSQFSGRIVTFKTVTL